MASISLLTSTTQAPVRSAICQTHSIRSFLTTMSPLKKLSTARRTLELAGPPANHLQNDLNPTRPALECAYPSTAPKRPSRHTQLHSPLMIPVPQELVSAPSLPSPCPPQSDRSPALPAPIPNTHVNDRPTSPRGTLNKIILERKGVVEWKATAVVLGGKSGLFLDPP